MIAVVRHVERTAGSMPRGRALRLDGEGSRWQRRHRAQIGQADSSASRTTPHSGIEHVGLGREPREFLTQTSLPSPS